MVELNQLLQLLPVIGTDQEHCPMLLGAAASTLETMLSLSVNIDVDSAGAIPTESRAMVTAGGDRAMQQDDATTSVQRFKPRCSLAGKRERSKCAVWPYRPHRTGG